MESKLINLSVLLQESFVQHHDQKVLVVKNDDEIRPWADLPDHILDMIFSFLLEFDHLSFRLTCKTWQSPVLCPSISSSIQKFPWLMSHDKSQSGFKFYSPISNSTYVMKIPKLAGAYFHCSRFGWLLMSRSRRYLFFYNPFIPDSTIQIPDFRYPEFVSMSFTAPPTSPDCIVFAHRLSPKNLVIMHTWGYREDKWTEYMIDCQAPFSTSLCTPFFYKDVFYHLDLDGRLGILDPKRSDNKNHQKLTWNDLPQPPPHPIVASNDITIRYYYKNYVAECDGQCVLVFVGNNGDPIHVFELDWSQMVWVTLQSLGNKAMFIGETGSLLIKTTSGSGGGGAENKIYFPRFVRTKGYGKSTDVGNGVFYCLETCKYHAFESEFFRGNWEVHTAGVSQFVWIEPNFQRDDWFRFLEDCDHNYDDNAV